MRNQETTTASYRFRVLANGVETHRADTIATGDPDELWHEAAMSACDMIRNMYGRIEPGLDWRLEVTDRSGKVISQFSFKAEMPL
ncbi:DUF6894 family protein [Bradyrhizobium genosp. P]|uniref:DUF6894 family protein n=1 Tax=Bradyrhizobium genosp. P TaxID=83641 RepID=UPI003CF10D08